MSQWDDTPLELECIACGLTGTAMLRAHDGYAYARHKESWPIRISHGFRECVPSDRFGDASLACVTCNVPALER